mmetsp:Transcript_25977/g.49005  ORF Transcript_25977/g.49005 Transcript_25977/m.49005 type:complete len:144 (-) Transcript_25977:59-490(-)
MFLSKLMESTRLRKPMAAGDMERLSPLNISLGGVETGDVISFLPLGISIERLRAFLGSLRSRTMSSSIYLDVGEAFVSMRERRELDMMGQAKVITRAEIRKAGDNLENLEKGTEAASRNIGILFDFVEQEERVQKLETQISSI